jgi:hypothetical protein
MQTTQLAHRKITNTDTLIIELRQCASVRVIGRQFGRRPPEQGEVRPSTRATVPTSYSWSRVIAPPSGVTLGRNSTEAQSIRQGRELIPARGHRANRCTSAIDAACVLRRPIGCSPAMEEHRSTSQTWHVRAEAQRQIRGAGITTNKLDQLVNLLGLEVLGSGLRKSAFL